MKIIYPWLFNQLSSSLFGATNLFPVTSSQSGPITGVGDVTFSPSSTITITGSIAPVSNGSSHPHSGSGNIYAQSGTTILNNPNSVPSIGCNAYPGDTIINGGNLQLNNIGQIPTATTLWLGETSSTSTTGSLTFGGSFSISNTIYLNSTASNGNILAALSGVTGTISSSISTSNSVLISGSGGTISLGTTSTLSGTVTVTSGATLQPNYAGALSSTPLVLNGGILDLNGYTTSNLASVALLADSNMKSTSGTNATCVATSYNLNNHRLTLASFTHISASQGITTGSITTSGTCQITFGYTLSSSINISGNLTIRAQ